MTRLLEGKAAVVTGGGGGIGRCVVMLLAEHGAKVVVNDPGVALEGTGGSRLPADAVVAEVVRRGGSAMGSYDSVATLAGAERIVKTAVEAYGAVDILVTCHGIRRDRTLFTITEDEWDSVVTANLKGAFAVIKYASGVMRHKRYGRIITFTGTAGLWGNPGQANYAAATEGVVGLTRVAARDLGRYGITVNCIAPVARTRMTERHPEPVHPMRSASAPSDEDVLGPPEAVAPLVVWLASEEAANVNGQLFYASGGLLGLVCQPEPVRTLTRQQGSRWTMEELAAAFPMTLGLDMVNPAPSMPAA